MLTVKVMLPGGAEEIIEARTIGWNPYQKSLAMDGSEVNRVLAPGEIAYVMNSAGKTISRFEHSPSTYQATELTPRTKSA